MGLKGVFAGAQVPRRFYGVLTIPLPMMIAGYRVIPAMGFSCHHELA